MACETRFGGKRFVPLTVSSLPKVRHASSCRHGRIRQPHTVRTRAVSESRSGSSGRMAFGNSRHHRVGDRCDLGDLALRSNVATTLAARSAHSRQPRSFVWICNPSLGNPTLCNEARRQAGRFAPFRQVAVTAEGARFDRKRMAVSDLNSWRGERLCHNTGARSEASNPLLYFRSSP